MSGARSGTERIEPYVPRLLWNWPRDGEHSRWQHRVGSLVSADISGFTALSEALATQGRAGAEQLTELINECFDSMIEACAELGGDILKFGGDALLVWFEGVEHTIRAAVASHGMRAAVERSRTTRDGKTVKLGVSIGAHSGPFTFFVVDAGHRELIVTGAGVTETVDCEAEAAAGQIMMSDSAYGLIASSGSRSTPGASGRHVLPRRALSMGATATEAAGVAASSSAMSGSGRALTRFVPIEQRRIIEAGSEAAHRQATIAFVKFSGTDELVEHEGPSAMHALVQRVADAIASATEEFSTHLLATDVSPDGGKFILTSGVPVSVGDDEERMLRTVRRIVDDVQSAGLSVDIRVGVNRGMVFAADLGGRRRRTFTVMGDAVNLAARLMQKAATGQVVAHRSVLDWSSFQFETDDLIPFKVKGKSLPVQAAVVGRALGAREDIADGLALIGRVSELQTLTEAANRAEQGNGSSVVVTGEPGVGRTRLVRELVRHCVGFRVGWVTCKQYEQQSAYSAAETLLRALARIEASLSAAQAGEKLTAWISERAAELIPFAPLIAVAFGAEVPATLESDAVAPERRRDRTNQLVVALMERVLDEATLIVIDDAPVIDDASRSLLDWMSAAAPQHRWMICEMADVLPAELPGILITHLQLEPLNGVEARRLATEVIGNIDIGGASIELLVERAQGNPLFLIQQAELLAEGMSIDDVSGSIESLVTLQVDRLTPDDRSLLRAASVLGTRVEVPLLHAVLGDEMVQSPDRWDRLAHLLVWQARGVVEFRHQIFHRIIYEQISFRRRRELHGAVGLVIETEARERGGDVIELLSLHYSRAEDAAKCWVYSVGAGDRAASSGAATESMQLYERAVAVHRLLPVHSSERQRVFEALGDAAERCARFDRAAEAYDHARRLARRPVDTARLLRKTGVLRERDGRYVDALRWFTRADKALTGGVAIEVDAERSFTVSATATIRHRQGKYRMARDLASQALDLGRSASSASAQAYAQQLFDIARVRLGDRIDPSASLALYETTGDYSGQAKSCNNLGVRAYFAGDWNGSIDWYRRSRELAGRAGDVILEMTALNNVAEVFSDQGRLGEATEALRTAQRTWRAARYPVGSGLATSNLGRAEARSGNSDSGEALLAAAIAELDRIGAGQLVLEARVRQVECAAFAADWKTAAARIETLRPQLIKAEGDVPLQAAFLRLEAIVASATNTAAADELIGKSFALASEAGARYELALTVLAARALGVGVPLLDALDEPEVILASLGVIDAPLPQVVRA
jgi:class 3 adenylate cyclase/tetratricopeptide (TPR) repeat protein